MPPATTTPDAAIAKLVAETDSLYSLPAVALEVLRLTESDSVDVAALKQTIEGDPALVVKILKVVNSSLFGLGGKVTNLTQALALLGARPLKMLVLGFSLPDGLLAEASAEQLERFWRASLTRALVARDLASNDFDFDQREDASPDDAFVAGLLQDIGVLVLLGRLGEPYAQLLATGADEGADLVVAERGALGFTRTDLSAALARDWGLPPAITDALARVGDGLARPVELADLLVRLVVDHQLDALPILLEQGGKYCGLTHAKVRAMVEPLERRVADLADAMGAPFADEDDYAQTVADAQARLAMVIENAITTPAPVDDDQLCEAMLVESQDLQVAMRRFLSFKPEEAAKLIRAEGAHTLKPLEGPPEISEIERVRLLDAVDKLARQTRASRHSLSLALVQVEADLDERATDRRLYDVLAAAAASQLGERRTARLTLGPQLIAVLLPAVGRGDAVAFLQDVQERLEEPSEAPVVDGLPAPEPIAARAGVATIDAVPNRFDPAKLLDAAEGCLATAKTSGPMRVRSIEVY